MLRAENSINMKIMCYVHSAKKLPFAQRKKYLQVAQVVPCQDKPKQCNDTAILLGM